jgi:cytochrome c-type biogenesis protein CcmH
MDGDRYRPVRRPPKAPIGAVLSAAQRDELEHHIHCQCGCTLDVYTCRTTDFTCPVSPAMHQDVVQLAASGYSGAEILAAFRETYGDRVLMAPAREGFNWAAYLAPFLALGAGAASLVVVLRRWKKPDEGRGSESGAVPAGPAGTPEELARLEAAIRDDAR